MSMSIADLKGLGFVHTHTICRGSAKGDKDLDFEAQEDFEKSPDPSVYLWVAEYEGQKDAKVLYVGKAGKGVHQRNSQHKGGFRRGVTGKKNSQALIKILSDPSASITVLARKADKTRLFGAEISLYSSEEEALCAVLRPELNRQLFPQIAPEKPEEASNSTEGISKLQKESISKMLNDRLMECEQGTVDDAVAQMEEVYSSKDRDLLRDMLTFVENELLDSGHQSKLVGGYTGQPDGCDGVTTLAFGEIGPTGRMKPNSWVARIYLGGAPKIALPLAKLNPMAEAEVTTKEQLFSPNNIQDMLRSPQKYLGPRGV